MPGANNFVNASVINGEYQLHKKSFGEVKHLQDIWACLQSGASCVALIMGVQQNPHLNSKGEHGTHAWGLDSDSHWVKFSCYVHQAIVDC